MTIHNSTNASNPKPKNKPETILWPSSKANVATPIDGELSLWLSPPVSSSDTSVSSVDSASTMETASSSTVSTLRFSTTGMASSHSTNHRRNPSGMTLSVTVPSVSAESEPEHSEDDLQPTSSHAQPTEQDRSAFDLSLGSRGTATKRSRDGAQRSRESTRTHGMSGIVGISFGPASAGGGGDEGNKVQEKTDDKTDRVDGGKSEKKGESEIGKSKEIGKGFAPYQAFKSPEPVGDLPERSSNIWKTNFPPPPRFSPGCKKEHLPPQRCLANPFSGSPSQPHRACHSPTPPAPPTSPANSGSPVTPESPPTPLTPTTPVTFTSITYSPPPPMSPAPLLGALFSSLPATPATPATSASALPRVVGEKRPRTVRSASQIGPSGRRPAAQYSAPEDDELKPPASGENKQSFSPMYVDFGSPSWGNYGPRCPCPYVPTSQPYPSDVALGSLQWADPMVFNAHLPACGYGAHLSSPPTPDALSWSRYSMMPVADVDGVAAAAAAAAASVATASDGQLGMTAAHPASPISMLDLSKIKAFIEKELKERIAAMPFDEMTADSASNLAVDGTDTKETTGLDDVSCKDFSANSRDITIGAKDLCSLVRNFVSGGRDFIAESREFGTSDKDVGPNGRDFGGSTKDFGSSGRDFGSSGRDFGPSGKDFGASTKDFGSSGRDFGSSGRDFGPSGKDFGASTKDFVSSGRDFGPSGRDFSSSTKDFGQNDRDFSASAKDFSPNGRDFSASAKDFIPSGRDFGANAKDFDASGRDFGANAKDSGPSGREFGICSQDFGTSAREFGTSAKDFDSSGKDFGTSSKDIGMNEKDYSSVNRDFGSGSSEYSENCGRDLFGGSRSQGVRHRGTTHRASRSVPSQTSFEEERAERHASFFCIDKAEPLPRVEKVPSANSVVATGGGGGRTRSSSHASATSPASNVPDVVRKARCNAGAHSPSPTRAQMQAPESKRSSRKATRPFSYGMNPAQPNTGKISSRGTRW